jgi:hypothetical protein
MATSGASAFFFHSSKKEVPRANKKKDEHKKCEEKTAQNLLAWEFHWYAASIGKLYRK